MKKILVILAIAVALVMPLMANGSSEQGGAEKNVTLKLPGMTREERDIVLAGCLINYYAR